jgi:NAD(P)-dependent dehydrogenase (short-subunit alcohol dehydrogenase family)
MDLGLKGRRALIAGASKGLGKACAKALADEGARIFICARNKEALKRVASECDAAGYSAADVSIPAEVSISARRKPAISPVRRSLSMAASTVRSRIKPEASPV